MDFQGFGFFRFQNLIQNRMPIINIKIPKKTYIFLNLKTLK